MKNNNEVEVIRFTTYSFKEVRQKELVRWLGTTAQSAIDRRHEKAKKLVLKTLKGTPAIYSPENESMNRNNSCLKIPGSEFS